jgi:hypothetical protein
MNRSAILYSFLLLSFGILACNEFMYTPRSRKTKLRETPSMRLCERIVEFRMEYGRWPASREDIANKGKQYYEGFQQFRYTYTHFKTVDSNNMIFSFSGHPQDAFNYEDTRKIELNSFGGTISFFKVNGKMVWKIKMN